MLKKGVIRKSTLMETRVPQITKDSSKVLEFGIRLTKLNHMITVNNHHHSYRNS